MSRVATGLRGSSGSELSSLKIVSSRQHAGAIFAFAFSPSLPRLAP